MNKAFIKEQTPMVKRMVKDGTKHLKSKSVKAIRNQNPGLIGWRFWATLDATYTSTEPKRSHNPTKFLMLFGRMIRAFRVSKPKGTFNKGRVAAEVTNSAPYFNVHEDDDREGIEHIPRRPVMLPMADDPKTHTELEVMAGKELDSTINKIFN